MKKEKQEEQHGLLERKESKKRKVKVSRRKRRK
jgi:hypothetical protein